MSGRVAWVMVNHNGGEETFLSAESVLGDLKENDVLVLVDNGTTDGSGQRVAEELRPVHYIDNHANLPFASANNRGIRWALEQGFDYIGIINPDVRLHAGMTELLKKRLAALWRDGAAAVSPVILFEEPPNTIWFAGGYILWPFAWIGHKGLHRPVAMAHRFDGSTTYLSGCCWLAHADAWRLAGPLDKRYGMYTEDVDWSVRARERGVQLQVNADARLIHRISQSSGGGRTPFKMSYRTLTNRLFFRRHTGRGSALVQPVLRWLPVVAYAGLLLSGGEFAALKSYLPAQLKPVDDSIPWPPIP